MVNKQRGVMEPLYLALLFAALVAATAVYTTVSHKIASLEGQASVAKTQKAETQSRFDSYVAITERNAREAVEATAAKERKLRAAADQAKEAKDEELKDRDARIAALSRELRNRPSRITETSAGHIAASATAKAGEIQGCTGAELYREDAGVLIGIGSDADQLRADYNELWTAYESARTQAAEGKVGQ